MDEELLTTTLPKKQNGATKSIMRPSRKTAEEKSRAKILEASQNNGTFSYKSFKIKLFFVFQNQMITYWKSNIFMNLFFETLDIIK